MNRTKKYDVFVSYSHEDEKVSRQICKLFDENSISYFIDKESIHPASNWLGALADSIRSCKIFLLLVSQHSFESEYSMMELQYAYSERTNCEITILPYLIDEGLMNDTMPEAAKMMLNSIQWIAVNDVPVGKPFINEIRALLRGHGVEKMYMNSLPKVVDMHCYVHPDRTVAAQCTDCGKYLCSECASEHSPCLCPDCYEARLRKDISARRKTFFKRFTVGAIMALIFWELIFEEAGFSGCFFSLVIFVFPFGRTIFTSYGNLLYFITVPYSFLGGIYLLIRDFVRLFKKKIYDSDKKS